jgi:NADH-quinone oxidoreductase subunit K
MNETANALAAAGGGAPLAPPMAVPLGAYLLLSAILFAIGVYGVLSRRNAISIFLSIELMLNAANLAFLSFGRAMGSLHGQVTVLFVIAVAAAEAAVGLAIMVAIFRTRDTIDVDELDVLRW